MPFGLPAWVEPLFLSLTMSLSSPKHGFPSKEWQKAERHEHVRRFILFLDRSAEASCSHGASDGELPEYSQ